MITKFNLFEGIRWWKNGKLGEEEPDDSKEQAEYDDFITNDEFRNFLIGNNCYESYIKNTRKRYKYDDNLIIRDVMNGEISDYIDNAFTWNSTPEGSRYWEIKDSKWKNQCGYDEDIYDDDEDN